MCVVRGGGGGGGGYLCELIHWVKQDMKTHELIYYILISECYFLQATTVKLINEIRLIVAENHTLFDKFVNWGQT